MDAMYGVFFQHFLRNPSYVGAIVPVSSVATCELLKELKERSGKRHWNILDAGAGIGNISEKIIPMMREGDHLDVVEIDSVCCEYMRSKFHKNKNVRVVCSSILNWKPETPYDFIVSTLPFNNFESTFVEQILNHYMKISRDGALCSYIEYMGFGKIKELITKESKRADMERRRRLIDEFQQGHLVEKNSIYLHLFPCYIYHLQLNKNKKRKA